MCHVTKEQQIIAGSEVPSCRRKLSMQLIIEVHQFAGHIATVAAHHPTCTLSTLKDFFYLTLTNSMHLILTTNIKELCQ